MKIKSLLTTSTTISLAMGLVSCNSKSVEPSSNSTTSRSEKSSASDSDAEGEESGSSGNFGFEYGGIEDSYSSETRFKPKAKDLERVQRELADSDEGCNSTSYPPQVAAKLNSDGNQIRGREQGVNYQVTGDSIGEVDVNAAAYIFDIVFNITDANSNTVRRRAEEAAQRISNQTVFGLIGQKEATEALDEDGSIKEYCTVLMAKSLKQASAAGEKTDVTFNKPVPVLISPKASNDRFLLEVGKGRKISNVVATVESTDKDVAPNGSVESKGSVEIIPIKPDNTVRDSSGSSKKFSADYAFRISFKFTNPDGSSARGLDSITDYYIADGDVVGIVVETGMDELPLVVYD